MVIVERSPSSETRSRKNDFRGWKKTKKTLETSLFSNAVCKFLTHAADRRQICTEWAEVNMSSPRQT